MHKDEIPGTGQQAKVDSQDRGAGLTGDERTLTVRKLDKAEHSVEEASELHESPLEELSRKPLV
jgi:hypothetical protein